MQVVIERERAKPKKRNVLPLIERIRKYEVGKGIMKFNTRGRDYYAFSLEEQVGRKLITDEIFDELCEQKKLLSVGCGPAHLEGALIALGAAAENIALADQKKYDTNVHNQGIFRPISEEMKFYEFDMFGKWPEQTVGQFNYVIFGQSLEIALYAVALERGLILHDSRQLKRQRKEVQNAIRELAQLKEKDPQIYRDTYRLGKIGLYEAAEELVPKDILEKEGNALEGAMNALLGGGQIRIGGDQMPYYRLCYQYRRLGHLYEEIERTEGLTVITKKSIFEER
jgi:hypothetical protein